MSSKIDVNQFSSQRIQEYDILFFVLFAPNFFFYFFLHQLAFRYFKLECQRGHSYNTDTSIFKKVINKDKIQ